MSISPISFRASSDFQSLINKPQAHQVASAASTGIMKSTPAKKSHGLRNTIVFLAAAGTALAIAAKKGKLDYTGDNTILKTASKYGKLVGEKILTTAQQIKSKVIGSTNTNRVFVDADVVGTARDKAAVSALNLATAQEKLAKAQEALKGATGKAAEGIQRQIDKLTSVINNAK